MCARMPAGGRYEPEDEDGPRAGASARRGPSISTAPTAARRARADQYVLDYARTFGLPAVVFRMSCIYGPHQFGTEDQGWVAHFLIRALEGEPITLYGDGMQVRDVLYRRGPRRCLPARAGNGSPELTRPGIQHRRRAGEHDQPARAAGADRRAARRRSRGVRFEAWRPGDQRYYVSDTRSSTAATGWSPQVGVEVGVGELYRWLRRERRQRCRRSQRCRTRVDARDEPEPVEEWVASGGAK